MYSWLSDGAEYLTPRINRVGATTLGDIGNYIAGNTRNPIQVSAAKDTKWLLNRLPGVSPKVAAQGGRLAGRAIPLLSALANASDVADIVTGDESLANKAMDTAAMGVGGTAGFFLGGPLGASMGASLGKGLSDGTQWLFGDKKTPEQRKMELALAQLQGGGMF